jgi:hypothetical protein
MTVGILDFNMEKKRSQYPALFTSHSWFAAAQHHTLGQHSIRRDSNFALLPKAFQSANLNRALVGGTF